MNDSTKGEQSSLDISKRVVNRVESLRQFLLHGRLTSNQPEQTLSPISAVNIHGDGSHDSNSTGVQLNPHHHGFVTPATVNTAGNHQQHTQCSCRPSANGGAPTQGLVAHRQAAFLAAAAAASVPNCNQFRPAMAHTRRRSKSSERLGGGAPPRLSIATTPAFMATAVGANGPHHPQIFATPPFLFATFNPQEVVR